MTRKTISFRLLLFIQYIKKILRSGNMKEEELWVAMVLPSHWTISLLSCYRETP